MSHFCICSLIWILSNEINIALSIPDETNVFQASKHQRATNGDSNMGWKGDYEPEFSHRNGDHAFCDLDIISLDDKLHNYLSTQIQTLKQQTNPFYFFHFLSV